MSQIAEQFDRIWAKRGLLACVLWPVSVLMQTLVRARRLAYKKGWLQSTRLPVPVIVVGNRIVGGAGKTPTTIALIQHLQSRGFRPAVLTRGYKANPSSAAPMLLDDASEDALDARTVGDEPMLIWRRTRAPVMIGRNRAQAGAYLLAARPEVNILVCDDGLQHLQLQRDIEIVVFDERGQGNGWLLPAGPLREPIDVKNTQSAGCKTLVLYNAHSQTTRLPGFVSRRYMKDLVNLKAWWSGERNHESACTAQRAPQPGNTITALAGIAQPQRFFQSLRDLGYRVDGLPLADHADFAELPWPETTIDLVVTEKDAVKLSPSRLTQERPGTHVWVAAIDLHPAQAFWHELDSALDNLANCLR